ncbi:FAD-dependent oxidoreductase [Luteolibacter arcticus]|uniref:FAD-dependent oxidoreductase n=1 Tax=Luteolibacter arcticus TaxID=1581411 RepID=A0ABT3GRH5_9BACT|nr:FAD-dependent oxidoreductase [Luteolibacter arcticus]MCW1926100.1 FAD-dependent oxidoreductase [Luteolibacter arcticus]
MNRFLFFAASLAIPAFAAPVPYDVVVYGGTSGGVIAAVQVAKSGRSVVLVSPTAHLGGLTTSGLGWTDLGESSILGGLSREFYHRVYQHYQPAGAWNWQSRPSFGNAGQGGPAFNDTTQIASVFEPKVAEAIFTAMLAEEEVPVITGRLDLDDGVVMSGGKIDRLKLEDGREFSGKMFIDASYEGDLLPGAGVTFTIGREANATHGETYNGIQAARATKNQLRDGIDPYVVPGNAASGLLPGVNADVGGVDGSSDARLQAYCFRMVLTDVAANRVAIAQPPGYNEADYELLFRSIEAGQTTDFFKFDLMPNRKTDSNNRGGISTDFIGKNYGPGWNWATLDHDERLALAKQHENWQRGLVWTLQNHSRVPASIRNAHAAWGLPADEFTDNGNWPWQLYVREARRMVSDYVMRQAHCSGEVVAPDSVGLAAYAMDSHHVQRHVKDGKVKNEGDVQMPVGNPYPVSYRSIVPKAGECPNLLVPWSISASHMAFGSIRMEPVFMILAQSAAIAADLALDGNLSVQQVPYAQLRPVLLAAGQALGEPTAGLPTSAVDNSDSALVTTTGAWISGNSSSGFVGSDYLHNDNAGQGSKQVAFAVPAGVTGTQRVFLRWTSHTNRASNVPVVIQHAGGSTTVMVDQKSNGGRWNLLGIFSGIQQVTVKTTGVNGYVIADAVGFSAVTAADDSDDDGMSDLREIELGLDAMASNAPFIEAVKYHPDYFGLHSENEIHDLRVARPGYGGSPAGFRFSLEGKTTVSTWDVFEDFEFVMPPTGPREFFRVALRTEPAGFVSALAAGLARKVVVYGTSLTANGAWVGQMTSWLTATYPGQLTVINSGLSGKNSAEGVAQLQAKVLAHDPDAVFIEFAMNDAFLYSDGTPQLSVEQARANLNTMIDSILAQNPPAEIILQTMNTVWNSPNGSNQSATLRPNLAAYYEMYRSVAAARGLMLIDHQPNWAALQQGDLAAFKAWVPDGVHPVAQGLGKVVLPLLKWKLTGGQ